MAAKKVSAEDRERETKEFEQAAEELFDGQVFMVENESEKKAKGLCLLPGCTKEKDGDEKHKYCSRRHFYLHQFRQGRKGDEWQKAAKCAMSVLAMESIGAEAAEVNLSEGERPWTNTMLVLVFFAMVGMLSSSWLLKDVIYEAVCKVKNALVIAYDRVSVYLATPSVGLSHGGGSHVDTANDPVVELNDVVEPEGYTVEQEMEEQERWSRLYEMVCQEEGQEAWRRTLETLNSAMVTAHMRGHVIWHCRPEVRQQEFLKLSLKDNSFGYSDAEICQWHRFLNAHFDLIVDIHVGVRKKEKALEELNKQLVNQNEGENRHEKEKRKFENGELCDRQQQTRLTFDSEENAMMASAVDGAWRFTSMYESRV